MFPFFQLGRDCKDAKMIGKSLKQTPSMSNAVNSLACKHPDIWTQFANLSVTILLLSKCLHSDFSLCFSQEMHLVITRKSVQKDQKVQKDVYLWLSSSVSQLLSFRLWSTLNGEEMRGLLNLERKDTSLEMSSSSASLLFDRLIWIEEYSFVTQFLFSPSSFHIYKK